MPVTGEALKSMRCTFFKMVERLQVGHSGDTDKSSPTGSEALLAAELSTVFVDNLVGKLLYDQIAPDDELVSELDASARTVAARCGQSYLIGIGVVRSTGTAVTLFLGEPSITRSE